MAEGTVTSKGQITIPAEIRHALGLTAGHRVTFTRLPDGRVVMRAKTRSILDMGGMLKREEGAPKVEIEDMNFGRS